MGSSTGVRLAVDIGESTTAAAVDRDGRRAAVVFADQLTLPTPTVDDAGQVQDLLTALGAVSADDAEPVLTVLAGHLRAVAAAAGTVDTLLVITPPGWGPRRQQLVIRAAQTAGLPTPQLLNAAAAIAAHTFPDAADDVTVLVIQADQQASTATIVQRHDGGWARIATQPVPAATGHRLDQALAQLVGADPAGIEAITDQLHAARGRLTGQQTAAVMLPGRPTPLTLTTEAFDTAVEPLRQAVIDAARDTIDAADVDTRHLAGIVVHGDAAAAIAPPHTLSQHLGAAAIAVPDGRLGAVYGALTAPADAAAGPRRVLRAVWGRHGIHLIAPVAAIAAGAVLQWQIFDIVTRSLPPEIYRHAIDYQNLPHYFDTAAFATAGWAALLGVLAAARTIVATLITDPASPTASVRQAGQMYAFAAVVGLAVASLQGLLAQAILGGPPELAPPYLILSLAGAIVPALIAITIGLAAPWLSKPPPWTDRLHHPTAAVVLAAAGIAAANARDNGLPIQGVPRLAESVLGLFGAGLLGVAIALTVVTHRYARLLLGAFMGTACMIIVGVGNLRSATTIYLVVVALWWIRRGSRILIDNLPPQWWRLADTDERRHKPANSL